MTNMVSQKAGALAKYTKAKNQGMVYAPWHVLNTVTMNLIVADEITDVDIDEAMQNLDEVIEQKCIEVREGLKEPYFVRACPLQPRPGVLESSVANDNDEHKDELYETISRIATKMLSKEEGDSPMYEHGYVEPEGCIIIQHYIDADASAVVAPNSYIFVGRDNDGITAGKDGVKVAIPHKGDNATTDTLKKLKIEPDKIELEFVSMLDKYSENLAVATRGSNAVEHYSYIVQLRGSSGHTPISPPPAGVTINGIIPNGTVTVTHLHIVSDGSDEELSSMEARLRDNTDEGLVIMYPTGSHMSHHAGQCRKYNVPFIVSDSVTIGSTWVEVASGWVIDDPSFEARPYTPDTYIEEYLEGINVGMNHFGRQYGWLSTQFHQFIGGPLTDVEETAFYGGVFTGWLVSATLSVGMGEMRHSPTYRNKNTPLISATLHGLYQDNWEERSTEKSVSSNRKDYYTAVENRPATLDSIILELKWLEKMYRSNWQSGYGGTKYANSCKNAKNLASAIKDLIKEQTKENLMEVIGHANMTENNIHNTSFFFNKFILSTPLDWGTDPTKVTISPRDFFRVWYAAKDASEHRGVKADLKDTTHIIRYSNKQTLNGLRENPLFLRADLPAEMLGASVLTSYWNGMLHSGLYGVEGEQFIPCGADGCVRCAEVVLNNIGKAIPKLPTIGKYLDMDFPKLESEGLLTYSTEEIEQHLSMAQELVTVMAEQVENDRMLYYGYAYTLLKLNMKDAYPYNYASKILSKLSYFITNVKASPTLFAEFAEYCAEAES